MSTFDASSRVVRYDVRDLGDLAHLIETGLIWRGGPKTQRLAIDALLRGEVPRPDNLPAQIIAFLDGSRIETGDQPRRAIRADSARVATTVDPGLDRDGEAIAPAASQWTCPDHGRSGLITLTSCDGRVYAACDVDECEAFEVDDLPEAESPDAALQEPSSVIDYAFPGHEGFLEHVTFQTRLVDGRLQGRVTGTYDQTCQFSAEYDADEDDYVDTDHHVIDVSTDYVDLATSVDLPHRVSLIATSQEIREYYASELFRRAYRQWSHDDCIYKPGYEARLQVQEEAARAQAEARANAPQGRTSFGTSMTPALEGAEETASQDGELAARAIDYAARYGKIRRVPGQAVADRFYESLNQDRAEWDQLCDALILSARADLWIQITRQHGTDGLAQVSALYRSRFVAELERHLHRLGGGGWPAEDPGGPIGPWLQLLGALERASRPSLARRLLGKRG